MELAKLPTETDVKQISVHERILRRTSEILERNRQLTALNTIATSVSQSLDLSSVLENATEQIMYLMEFEAGWISLLDGQTSQLTLSVHRGLSAAAVDLLKQPITGHPMMGSVVQTGEPLIGHLPMAREDALGGQLRRDGFSFFVAFPLKAKGKTLGVMTLCCQKTRIVDRGSSEFLSSVGDIIGVAVENASLYHNIAQIAEQLKVSEHKYRSLIEKAKDAVLLIQDGRICYANQSAVSISGYSLDELYQLNNALDLVAENDRAAVQQWCQQIAQDEDVASIEMVARHKDGHEIHLEVRGSTVEVDGRPATQFIVRDVSEQKLLREQIVRSEKMAALGQLISGVAHELNNPLTVVIGYSELLTLAGQQLPESVQRGLSTIQEAAQRAGKIVQNLLTFARKHQATQARVKMNELIEHTLALRAYEMSVNDIEVEKDLAEDLPETVADPHQLQQVFMNLIVNAEQAMLKAHSRGRLRVQTREKVGYLPKLPGPTRLIEITFSDDGPGIAPEHLSRIFEPFFTTKDIGEGTGLGLSISHAIIRAHRGRIDVRSELGKGATFVIELPIVQQASVVAHEATELPPRRQVTPKDVLIIDDEVGIVNLLRRIISDEGHRVETAANGSEALSRLANKEYDLIFCDYKMPQMNGQELFRELERRNGRLAKKIVFVTGDTVSPQTRDFLATCGSKVLEKPFITQEIIRVVRTMLSDH